MNFNTKLSGEYMFEIRRGDGTIEKTDWMKNLILDSGMDRIGTSGACIQYCRVGTGTSVPTVTQTALDTQIASTSTAKTGSDTVTNAGSPTYASNHTWNFAFTQGAVIGNITEVGVGWSTTGNTLFSRSLIVDGSNNPITLTLTSIDQLTVYYKLTFTPNLNDITGTITLAGSSYSYVGRLYGVTAFYNNSSLLSSTTYFGQISLLTLSGQFSGVTYTYGTGSGLGSVTSNGPSGSVSGTNVTGSSEYTASTYVAGNYYLDNTITFGTTKGNATGGIKCIRYSSDTYYTNNFQYEFTPEIPKDNTKTLSLTFRLSWSR